MSFRKRKDRHIRKTPEGIDGLMGDFMQRHGFERQVTAAMLVRKANEFLDTLLSPEERLDIRALSFKDGYLKIAVRHAPAGYRASQFFEELRNKLLREFPKTTIRSITHKLDPNSFEDSV